MRDARWRWILLGSTGWRTQFGDTYGGADQAENLAKCGVAE